MKILRTLPDKKQPGRAFARSGFLLNEGAGVVGTYRGERPFVHGELTTSIRQNIVADISGVRYIGLHILNQRVAKLRIAKAQKPGYKSPDNPNRTPKNTTERAQRMRDIYNANNPALPSRRNRQRHS